MKLRKTEAQYLQNFGVVFENVKKDTVLATEMELYGYDAASIAQGEALYTNFLNLYNINKTETAEALSAHQVFSDLFEPLLEAYITDRKKARIVFKSQPDVLTNLQLNKGISPRNAKTIDDMRLFYDMLLNNPALVAQLVRLRFDAAHLNNQIAKVASTQSAYATYVQEKGESQQATKDKDQAFDEVYEWVMELYSVAKIALEDKPQLLESIAKFVRS